MQTGKSRGQASWLMLMRALRFSCGCGAGEMPCCPGILEVEATGNAINIENLTGKVEARGDFALQGRHIDVIDFYSAAGNKLVLVDAFS